MHQLRDLQVPEALRKWTSVEGPRLGALAAARREKLEVAEETQASAARQLDGQIAQARAQADAFRHENRELAATLRDLCKPRPKTASSGTPGGPSGTQRRATLDATRAKLRTTRETLSRLQADLARETAAAARPSTPVEAGLVRVRALETRLDEAQVRLQEALGSQELLGKIAERLGLERVRFAKELDFCRVENDLVDADLRDVRGYRAQARGERDRAHLELLEAETRAEDQRQQEE